MGTKDESLKHIKQALMQGDFDAVLEATEQSVRKGEINDEALSYRALAYFRLGHMQKALQTMASAIQKNPNEASHYQNLAVFCYQSQQPKPAIEALQKAIALEPNNGEFHKNLGLIYRDQGRWDEAAQHLYAALESRPNNAELLNTLGLLEQSRQNRQASLGLLQRALTNATNKAMVRDNIGLVMQELGDIRGAREQFKTAITENPSYTRAHYHLAHAKRHKTPEDSTAEIMQTLLRQGDLASDEQSELNFALGKVFDDCGDYAKAFDYYLQANAANEVSFEVDKVHEAVDAIKTVFTKRFFERHKGQGSDSSRPIFILGMPRSGTTLVEQVLSVHSKVHAAGELMHLGTLVQSLPGAYPSKILSITEEKVSLLAEAYLKAIAVIDPAAHYVTDKMPANFQYVGVIALLFPDAHIIWCQRDPRDVCLSCFFTHFKTRIPYTYNLGVLARYYVEYHRLMTHWQAVIPRPMHAVQYEALVSNPQKTIQTLLDYCDLPWEPACLDASKSTRTVHTASSWQVRQPLYQHSKHRWKHYEPYISDMMRLFRRHELIEP